LQGLSQEEEEMENHPWDPATKMLRESETSSTLRLDEPLDPLVALEGLMTLEDQEDLQMCPLLILSLSNLPTT